MNQLKASRRDFLKWLSITGATSATGLGISQLSFAESYPHKVHVVVAGAGMGGLAVANKLRRQLPNAKITIVDAKKEHNYQPGYTLIATGVWKNIKEVKYQNHDYIAAGIDWIQEAVVEFDPDNNRLVTELGKQVNYDYLVVATGIRLGYEQIEGIELDAFGHNGLGSVYASPEIAQKTWYAMDAFRNKGGRAIMTTAPTAIKCAGAPLKATFMLHDRLLQAGMTKDSAQIDYFTPSTGVFSVPEINENVLERWQKLAISPTPHFKKTLRAVDVHKKVAYFDDADGNRISEDYDFLHVVPPMFAPDAVLNSKLAVAEGKQKGWLEVNKETLQHTRYPNVFGIGDVNGTPRGKTAATVKKSAPIVTHNLLQVIQGKSPDILFDGYTSCPLLLREGSALLIEFNDKGELTPTVPGVKPLQESYFAWFTKYMMLKPAYMAVIKGNID